MANKQFDGDEFMAELRRKHPKQGPDPKRGEPIDRWAERYMEYIRKKYNLKEP